MSTLAVPPAVMMNCVDVGGNRAEHSNQIDRDYDQDIKLGGPIAKD